MRTDLTGWLRVVVLGVLIFAAYRHRVQAEALDSAANVWDVIIPVQADLYLLAHLFVPVWVLQLARQLPDRTGEIWLLRFGGRVRWLLSQVRWAAGQAAVLLAVWMVGGLVLAAGLPWSTGWSGPAAGDGVLHQLQAAELGPVATWGLQWLAYLTLFTAVGTVMAISALTLRRPSAHYLVAGTTYLTLVVVIRGGDVGSGLFVYRAVADGGWAGWPAVASLIIAGFAIGAFTIIDQAKSALGHVDPSQYTVLACYAAIVTAGVVATAVNLGSSLTSASLLAAAHYGFDEVSLNAGVYSYFILVNLGFVLLYMVKVEQRLWPLFQLVSIRSGSPRRWMLRVWRDICVTAVALVALLYLFTVGVSVVASAPLGWPELGLRSYHFIVNGILQILIITGLAVLVAYLSRS